MNRFLIFPLCTFFCLVSLTYGYVTFPQRLLSSSSGSSSSVLSIQKLAKGGRRRTINNSPKINNTPRNIKFKTDINILALKSKNNQDDIVADENDAVQLGSKDYYSGFISRGINEEPEERVTGDAVLVPTLKFVGGFAAILIVLFVGFLVSNGLV